MKVVVFRAFRAAEFGEFRDVVGCCAAGVASQVDRGRVALGGEQLGGFDGELVGGDFGSGGGLCDLDVVFSDLGLKF